MHDTTHAPSAHEPAHHHPLDDHAHDQLFRHGRTHNFWLEREVSDEPLRQLYDLMKWAPTSANCSPARILFLRGKEAKERLRPALAGNNVEKTMLAPVTALIGYDVKFYDLLPRLFPHNQTARSWFSGDPALAELTAFRNGTLQGGYLILAARSLGLDCGPMSGFDNALVDREFFGPGRNYGFDATNVKSNFLCNLGYGDHAKLFPRSPRLPFEEACAVI